jgi:hypothetical protein
MTDLDLEKTKKAELTTKSRESAVHPPATAAPTPAPAAATLQALCAAAATNPVAAAAAAGGAKRAMPAPPARGKQPEPPAAAAAAAAKKVQARAQWDFAATDTDELSFKKGDVITILEEDDDWWVGELNGKKGTLPRNYVVKL